LPCDGVTEKKTALDEIVSANVTPVAEAIPLFVMVNWIVSNSPIETGEGDAVPVNCKFGVGAPKPIAAQKEKTKKLMSGFLQLEIATLLIKIRIPAIISHQGI
jgi:hypothetical protein